MPAPTTLDELLTELRDENPAVLHDALCVVDEFHDPSVCDALLEALSRLDLEDELSASAASVCVEELRRRGDRRMLETLTRWFKKGPDVYDEFGEQACEVFASMRCDDAVPLIEKALMSKRWEDCEDALVKALVSLQGQDCEEALLEALRRNSRPQLQLAALDGLRALGSERCASAVSKLLASDESEVRFSARITLALINGESAVELVRDALEDAEKNGEQGMAWRFVCGLKNPDLHACLVEFLGRPEWEGWRLEVLQRLGEQKSDAARGPLMTLARSGTPWTQGLAHALLLRWEYNADIVQRLFDLVLGYPENTRDDDEMQAASTCAVVRDVLCDVLPATDHRQFVRWLFVLDDVRRERLPAPRSFIFEAGKPIQKLAGSSYFSAFDAWVERYCERHALGSVDRPSKPIHVGVTS